MTTTPVEGAQTQEAAVEAAPESTDELIHDVTSTDSLPASGPTPESVPATSDAAPEPEPAKEPEANAGDEAPESEKVPGTEAWNARESTVQRQITEAKQAQDAAEQRAVTAESQTTQAQTQRAIQEYRDGAYEHILKTRDDLDESGALAEANRLTTVEYNQWTAQQGREQADTRVSLLEGELAENAKVGQVSDMMREHGVPESQREIMLSTGTNRDAAIALAKTLGEAEKNRVEIDRLTQAQVPVSGEEQQVDSGKGDGSMTDDQIIAAAGNSGGAFTDLVALDAAMRRKGMHPDQL